MTGKGMPASRGMSEFFVGGERKKKKKKRRLGRGGLELVLSVQHTSFPAAPAGRMFSWVS